MRAAYKDTLVYRTLFSFGKEEGKEIKQRYGGLAVLSPYLERFFLSLSLRDTIAIDDWVFFFLAQITAA